MHIIDRNGKKILIEDIQLAIKQAKAFTGYHHPSKQYDALDEERKMYWTHILEQLQELNNGKN